MTSRNYYEVLGLAAFADGVMVDQAYWHLAKTYQTLAVTDPRARLLLDDLNEAYGVLGTPRLREEYDHQIASQPVRASGRAPRHVGKSSSWLPFALPAWRPFHALRKGAPVEAPAPARPAPTRPAAMVTAHATASVGPAVKATPRPRKGDVGDLRASTARMLERWRTNAGIRSGAEQPDRAPDTTLVDIVQSERDLEDTSEPLNAVLDILRGSNRPVNTL